ncbi:MAG: DNA/RNA nuclease SfsA [Peptococcaceae bacterium]|nr:DNA/RNA nuclease SfsA [Peptococcaceae bacterium]
MFPDAPTRRGTRHIQELMKLKQQGCRTKLIFIIQRPDAVELKPHKRLDPEFYEALQEAQSQGVEIEAYNCHAGTSQMSIHKKISVKF